MFVKNIVCPYEIKFSLFIQELFTDFYITDRFRILISCSLTPVTELMPRLTQGQSLSPPRVLGLCLRHIRPLSNFLDLITCTGPIYPSGDIIGTATSWPFLCWGPCTLWNSSPEGNIYLWKHIYCCVCWGPCMLRNSSPEFNKYLLETYITCVQRRSNYGV